MPKEQNTKWAEQYMLEGLNKWTVNNDLSMFENANTAEDLGHPKAKPALYPMIRFFQEKGTEVLEIDADGFPFEMFDSMRIYIERNGRPYNYLSSVRHLNKKRDEALG